MPTIDDFIRPKEWVSPFVAEVGKTFRPLQTPRYWFDLETL
jgi:hypothetical protein